MRLAELPDGAVVFLDANVLAYHYTGLAGPLHDAASDFLVNIRRRRIRAYTSVIVVAEVIHRMLVSKATADLGVAPRQAAQYLKQHPGKVSELQRGLNIPSDIYHRFGISIEPVTRKELHAARPIRRQHGLMTNDSILLSVMQSLKISNLATNDSDFERVPDITIWRPLT